MPHSTSAGDVPKIDMAVNIATRLLLSCIRGIGVPIIRGESLPFISECVQGALPLIAASHL
jgi:hypothetical protein